MNIMYLGTPWFAAECLSGLIEHEVPISMVVTQPDRPQGRGMKLKPPPVKEVAITAGIPVIQPEKASSTETIDELAQIQPDLMIAVAYGELLKKSFLELPRFGIVNVHASLLPLYRGAAPVQWALINGETRTGLTVFFLSEGMDAGDIILQRELGIDPDEDAHALLQRMVRPSIEMLLETIALFESGSVPRIPQDDAGATYAPKIKKENGFINWDLPASSIYNLLKGLSPWPGIQTRMKHHGKELEIKIIQAHPSTEKNGPPGTILSSDYDSLTVAAGTGAMIVKEVQVAGKKRQTGGQFASGYQLNPGDRFIVDPSLWINL